MFDGGSLCKVFGCGLAFPTHTNDGRLVPEVGKLNPRADSFSLYLNYVGNKILENLLPKSKLNSKVHFVYTDKALKKKRREEEEKRVQNDKMNFLVKQAQEIRNNNSNKLSRMDPISPKNTIASKIGSKLEDTQTPIKKSFAAKIREQVNS